jgi:glutathione S-transferase
MIYLCELYPHTAHLYGSTIEERALTNQYISWYQSFFRPGMFKPMKLYIAGFLFKKKILQAHRDSLFAEMIEGIDKFNEILAVNKSKFMTGDKVKIVDFLFFYEMTNLTLLDI